VYKLEFHRYNRRFQYGRFTVQKKHTISSLTAKCKKFYEMNAYMYKENINGNGRDRNVG